MLFVAFVYVLIIIVMLFEENLDTNKKNPISVIAHRGASGYAPENTMAAFEKALAQNADFVELDIQMTKDKELIVIHDSTISRTTNGKGFVKDFSLKEIKKFDAGSWFHHSFSGEKIPTLNEVLNRYENKIGILLELKDPHLYPGIESKLVSLIKKRGLHNHNSLIVQSFDLNSIQRFHRLLPNISTGVLVTSMPSNEEIHKYSSFCQYINLNFLVTDSHFISLLKRQGFKCFIWTINNIESYHMVSKYNVEGIITDYPDFLQKTTLRHLTKRDDIVLFIQRAYQLFLELYEQIKKNF